MEARFTGSSSSWAPLQSPGLLGIKLLVLSRWWFVKRGYKLWVAVCNLSIWSNASHVFPSHWFHSPELSIQCGNASNIFSNEFIKNSLSYSALSYHLWSPTYQWGPFYISLVIPYLSLEVLKELFSFGLSIFCEVFSNFFFSPLVFLFTFNLMYLMGFAITLIWKTVLSFLDIHHLLLRVTLCFIRLLCFLFDLQHTFHLDF